MLLSRIKLLRVFCWEIFSLFFGFEGNNELKLFKFEFDKKSFESTEFWIVEMASD